MEYISRAQQPDYRSMPSQSPITPYQMGRGEDDSFRDEFRPGASIYVEKPREEVEEGINYLRNTVRAELYNQETRYKIGSSSEEGEETRFEPEEGLENLAREEEETPEVKTTENPAPPQMMERNPFSKNPVIRIGGEKHIDSWAHKQFLKKIGLESNL